MLKITTVAGEAEIRWVLCGQLSGPWVAELRSQWEANRAGTRRRLIVDLSEVTFIDENGEGLLGAMYREGAEFLATGVDTKHLLDNLNTTERRALRRRLSHLVCGCAAIGPCARDRAGKPPDE